MLLTVVQFLRSLPLLEMLSFTTRNITQFHTETDLVNFYLDETLNNVSQCLSFIAVLKKAAVLFPCEMQPLSKVWAEDTTHSSMLNAFESYYGRHISIVLNNYQSQRLMDVFSPLLGPIHPPAGQQSKFCARTVPVVSCIVGWYTKLLVVGVCFIDDCCCLYSSSVLVKKYILHLTKIQTFEGIGQHCKQMSEAVMGVVHVITPWLK